MTLKTIAASLLIVCFLSSCSPALQSSFYHDRTSVCTEGQPWYDKEECENWQQKHPREYARYLKRQEANQVSKDTIVYTHSLE